MNEQAKSTLRSIISGAATLAETIENVSEKVVNLVDEFAVNLEKQIDEAEAKSSEQVVRDWSRERAEAIRRHPAGKGRVENELTREEKIKYVQNWLDFKGTIWHTNPERIGDEDATWGYNYAKENPNQTKV